MAPLAGMGGIEGTCAAAGLSRAGFYRHFERHAPAEAQLQLRDLVQRLALQHRFYGHRRIQALLRMTGWVVNRKLTTNSRHPYFVYPNLAASAAICGCDQLWVADITYIRLAASFVYLALILDAYSRRVIGWELGETLEAKLAIAALAMALQQRRPQPGWIHHSDRGIQYCCRDYIALLEAHQASISMSRRANPYDNAIAESFMKTLKTEEVTRGDYRNAAHARAHIGPFLEQVYIGGLLSSRARLRFTGSSSLPNLTAVVNPRQPS